MPKRDYPTDLDVLLEPEASSFIQSLTLEQKCAVSTAVSLKRIADMLLGEDPVPALMASVNAYGENFAVAIQEGMVRGAAGISSYR